MWIKIKNSTEAPLDPAMITFNTEHVEFIERTGEEILFSLSSGAGVELAFPSDEEAIVAYERITEALRMHNIAV